MFTETLGLCKTGDPESEQIISISFDSIFTSLSKGSGKTYATDNGEQILIFLKRWHFFGTFNFF